jgi:hypothetical protein
MIFYARITFYIFCFSTVALILCCKNEPNTQPEKLAISDIYVAGDSVFVLWSDRSSQLLTAKGQDYEIVPSPDSQSIGINIRLLSNLQIAKIFPRDSTGKFNISETINISSIAWKMLQEQFSIDPETILRPKTRIISWDTIAHEVLVNVNGTFENGEEISHDLRIIVPVVE